MAELVFAQTRLEQGNIVGGRVSGLPCGGPITQVFGQLSVTGRQHGGIDIAVPEGTPILAPAPGLLSCHSLAERSWDFGNRVVIDHPGTPWYSAYAHLSAFAATEGPVEAGDVIGYAGATGLAFGSHLHWAVGRSRWFALDFDELADPASFVRAPTPSATPLSLEDRVARLERVLAGNGVRILDAEGREELLTGEAALAYIDRMRHSVHLGLAQTQDRLGDFERSVRGH